MKNLICSLLLFFCATTHSSAINKIDSLIQSLPKLVGRSKLETLYLIMSTSEGDELTKIEILKNEGIKQKDYLYVASAYQFMAYHYLYIVSDMDSTNICIGKGREALDQVTPDSIINPSDQDMYDKVKVWLNHFHVLTHIGRQEEAKAVKQIEDFMEANKDNSNLLYREFSYHQMGIIQGFLGNGQGAVKSLEADLKLQEADLNTFRSIVIGAAISIGLMILIMFMTVKRNRLLLEKNKNLFNQHKRAQQLLEGQQRLNLRETSDPQEMIMCKLDAFMKSSNIFLNPDLKRDELALEVGTNRQYLIDAIREKKNQTFNEYLYSLRLKYIYSRIENEKDISIAEVFSNSGFTSRGVFNREFKKEYGMTPSELQTIIRENNT